MVTPKQYLPPFVRFLGLILCTIIVVIVFPAEYARLGTFPWAFAAAISVPFIVFIAVCMFHSKIIVTEEAITVEYYPIYKKKILRGLVKSIVNEGEVKSPLATLGFIGIKFNGPCVSIANRRGFLLRIETIDNEVVSIVVPSGEVAQKVSDNMGGGAQE